MTKRINLTVEEKQAINDLELLAKKWPKTLTLFSLAGNLIVLKIPKGHKEGAFLQYEVADINGIPNDGGDA